MNRRLVTGAALACLLSSSILFAGCWDYREVDRVSIVAGVAIDKGETLPYEMTVEIVKVEDGGFQSENISAEGKTLFDAARNIIAVSGKRLYWSHNKVVIISQDIASQGIFQVLDWYNRDSETREDIHIMVSRAPTAEEVIAVQPDTESILSYALDDCLDSQVSLGKAPDIDIMDFDNETMADQASTILPAVGLREHDGKTTFDLQGCAIINDDQFVGFLDGEETKDALFLRNEIEGGLLIQEMDSAVQPTFVSLEIFSNKTKITTRAENGNIDIGIRLSTLAAIDEINGPGDYIQDEGLAQLKAAARQTLEQRLRNLITKMQTEYDADIFGFGTTLWENDPQAYRSVQQDWGAAFRNLNIDIQTELEIKNSAILAQRMREGN